MERWKNRIALVTGASAGIGASICQLLCSHGMKVVGCARRLEKLQNAVESPTFYPYQCDLANEAEIEALFEWIESHEALGKVEVCIANAGISANHSLLDGNVEEWKQMLDVNVLAVQLCTQLSVRSMLKNNIQDGQIIIVNSVSGHRVANREKSKTRFYSATKFAVTALVEGWRTELLEVAKGQNIRVAQVSPGMVRSEFALAMNGFDEEKARRAYDAVPCLQTQDVAQCIKFILEAPPRMQINDILVRPTSQRL